MRIFALMFLLSNMLFSMEYYSKLEPINSYVVKSAVSGLILYTNDNVEGRVVKNKTTIIEIDSAVDKIDLVQTKKKLKIIESMIEIEDNNYNRLQKVSSKSAFEKDNQKIKALNLKSSKSDLIIKFETLKDRIKKKSLLEIDSYIYNIAVEKNDYVNPGTVLYEAKDLSKGKLEIFIPISDLQSIQEKTIFIDDSKTDLKIDKIYKVADTKHISSYKCEIIINNPKTFSRLVKIEFK